MKKQTVIRLIALSFGVLIGCYALWRVIIFEKRTGYYISELTFSGTDLYFGAGNCLYSLDVVTQDVEQLKCIRRGRVGFARPAVNGEFVYGLSDVDALSLVAIDLSARKQAWSVDLSEASAYGPFSETSVFFKEGKVLLMGGMGLCVYDAKSGDLIQCTEARCISIRPEQAYFGERQFICLDKAGDIGELDINTGVLQKSIEFGAAVRLDALLYVDDSWILGTAEDSESYPYREHIVAIDRLHPQQVAWMSEVDFSEYVFNLRVSDGRLIFCADFYVAYALDMNTGQMLWKNSSASVAEEASADTEIMAFTVREGENSLVTALDAISGDTLWKYELVSGGRGLSDSLVNEGVVYVGNQRTIDALDLQTGALLWQVEVDSAYEFYVDRAGL